MPSIGLVVGFPYLLLVQICCRRV